MSTAPTELEQVRRIWKPVRQQAADSFLVMLIIAFAVTVIIVRVFLEMSGYPQVGNSTFHIAHLLWGGLLLFLSVVGILLWANHWMLWAAAIAGGIGVGLFIDEVGKFITQSNDYFFPLAFPIIYAFLLACVWLFLRVRRTRPRDSRTLLYHALEDMKQVLDHDLDPFEHSELVNELNQVIKDAQNPNEQRLARALLDFVRTEGITFAREPNRFERAMTWVKFILARWPSRQVFRWILIVGLALTAIFSVFEISALWAIAAGLFVDTELPPFVIMSGKSEYRIDNPLLLVIHALAILITGILAALAAVLLAIGRERLGLRIGTLSLVLSLTVVDLLTFYFSQLYAIGDALAQLALLLALIIYRWRFFLHDESPAAAAPTLIST